MTAIHPFASRIAVLAVDHVDTDQIIPARFLKTTDKKGLGRHAFQDWRYTADGSPNPGFPLNHPRAEGAAVLVAGANFGCGSSREHAAWALVGLGFRAVVASSFADIFHQNALKNGLIPIQVPDSVLKRVQGLGTGTPVAVDLDQQVLQVAGGDPCPFPMDPFFKHCLLSGTDALGYVLDCRAAIEAHDAAHPRWIDTLALDRTVGYGWGV